MTDVTPRRMQDGPQAGDVVELAIDALGFGGVGVGRDASGLVCLVPRTLPGERVEVEIVDRKPTLARARLRAVLAPSPQRVEPPCAYFPTCGGCHLQHLAYEDQLVAKREVFVRDLARALGDEVAAKVAAVVPSPAPLGYRNRTSYHVRDGRLGFVDPLAGALVEVDRCLVSDPAGQPVVVAVRAWLAEEGRALARSVLDVLVRTGADGAQCLVVLAAEDVLWAEMRALAEDGDAGRLQCLRPLAARIAPAALWISRKARARRTPFGDELVRVAGDARITERIGPFTLRLSPGSFVQANPAVAALLYAHATDRLAADGARALDLFCGSGALAFHVAQRAREVWAVEQDRGALADARASARRQGIRNVVWRAGRCETVAREFAGRGERFDVATVNPPRTGLHEDLPEALGRLGIGRLVYVSRSPPTLARDLVRLRASGFALQEVVPFDMFPQTHHLETATFLVRA